MYLQRNLEPYKDEIISRYLKGESPKRISDDLPFSRNTVKDRLQRWGIVLRGGYKKKIDVSSYKKEIIIRYLDGESTRVIAEDIPVCYSVIGNRLRMWGIRLRVPMYAPKYEINHDVFDAINEESAYFCGLLAADGNITRKRQYKGQLVITLTNNDLDVIEKFRDFVTANNDKPFYSGGGVHGNTFQFVIASEKIGQTLISYGIVPRKSLILNILNDHLVSNRHFWRGAIDGDGSVRKNKYGKPFLGLFSGSRVFIQQSRTFLDCNGIHKNTIHKTKGRSRYCLQYTGSFAINIFSLLYTDANVYMDRKYNIAQEFLKGVII